MPRPHRITFYWTNAGIAKEPGGHLTLQRVMEVNYALRKQVEECGHPDEVDKQDSGNGERTLFVLLWHDGTQQREAAPATERVKP